MVRLASVAVLATAAGSALALPSLQSSRALAARTILSKRGLFDFYTGASEGNTTAGDFDVDVAQAKESYLSLVDWSDPAAVGGAGVFMVGLDAAAAHQNKTSCASVCDIYLKTAGTCMDSVTETAGSGLECLCGKDLTSQIQSCSSCVKSEDSLAGAKNLTTFCTSQGYTVQQSGGNDTASSGNNTTTGGQGGNSTDGAAKGPDDKGNGAESLLKQGGFAAVLVAGGLALLI